MLCIHFISTGGRGFPTSGRHGIFRGQGQAFSPRRPLLSVDEFGRPFSGRYVGEDPYLYGDAGHGMKRPFSMMVSFLFLVLQFYSFPI